MKVRSIALTLALVSFAQTGSVLAQGGVTRFCTSGSAGSHLSAAGSASFTANGGHGDLVLMADHVGSAAPGLFFFGSNSIAQVPFGNGFRCVGGSVFRLTPVTPGPGSNVSAFALDYLAGHGTAITPGSTWNFQFWFRSAGTFDLSDALQVQFGRPSPLTPITTVVQGNPSSHPLSQTQTGGAVLIADPSAWGAFWVQHEGINPIAPPIVDFTQNVVIAVFAGTRNTGGYSIDVTAVHLSVATYDVTTVEQAPGANCAVPQIITQPFDFVTVPKVEHAVLGDWNHSVNVYTCP
jgi:hypothetical protein